SCTPREPPVTPTLSSQPSLCPKGGPGHLHCPHSPLAPQGKDLVTPGLSPQFIPSIHPGEPVFCAHLAPAPTLDTQGLQPQSVLEGFFLCNSPACQAAFVRNGGLSLLYRCAPTCPLPVLRWLFQLMTLCPDTTNASQALWEIWLSTGGEREPWCPTVQEIGWAFTRLGADLSPLRRQRLLPPELCPTERSARLALITLLSFLGLDRALRCQPLPELQHLLHCLLEGIRDWKEQLPALCLSLCQLSRHHHNLVALMRLLPDLTSRGRYVGPCRGSGLQALGRFLVLAQPDTLRRLGLAGDLEEPEDADQEDLRWGVCVWGSTVSLTPPSCCLSPQGHLERLCAQLDQHFGRGLREGSGLLFRTQLKGLAALLYVKWQEMLPPPADAGWARPAGMYGAAGVIP
uniref:Coiled-coil SMC6 And NSE5 INteracting (CANIN) domain-containing protein n=1 Tax=Accipiter nisus TaxID=211598 RepID=A0A8B9MXR9_9AVES